MLRSKDPLTRAAVGTVVFVLALALFASATGGAA